MVAQGSASQLSLVETQASPSGHCRDRQGLGRQVTLVGLQNCPGGQYMLPQGSGRQLPATQRWPARHLVASQRATQAPFAQY